MQHIHSRRSWINNKTLSRVDIENNFVVSRVKTSCLYKKEFEVSEPGWFE